MAVPLPKPPKPPSGIVDRGEALKTLLSGSGGSQFLPPSQKLPQTDILSAALTLPRTDPNSIDWDPYWRPIERTLNALTAGGVGMVNTVDKAVKLATDPTPSAIGNYLSHLGPVGDFTRGFWASLTSNKQSEDFVYGSDLIENISDRVGARFNPDYVDRENNVDPKLKFGAGLAIDIALDPITYLPGGIIASGVRGGVRAAQAATGLNKMAAGVKGIKQGAPVDYKLGKFTKQIKPTGYDEWVKVRTLEKLDRVARKNNVPTEGLLALADAKNADDLAALAAGFSAKAGRAFSPEEVSLLQKQIKEIRAGNRFYPISGSMAGAEEILAGVAKQPKAFAARAGATRVSPTGAAAYMTLRAGEKLSEEQFQKMRTEAQRLTKEGFLRDSRVALKTQQAAEEAQAKAEQAATARMGEAPDPETFISTIVAAGEEALRRYQPPTFQVGPEGISPNQNIFVLNDGVTSSPVGSSEAIARITRDVINSGDMLDVTLRAPSNREYRLTELLDGLIDGADIGVELADIEHLSRAMPRILENMQEARKAASTPKVEIDDAAKEIQLRAKTELEISDDVYLDPNGIPRPIGDLDFLVNYSQVEAYADELFDLTNTIKLLEQEISAFRANTGVEGFVYDINVKDLNPGTLEKVVQKEGITAVIDARALPNSGNPKYKHLRGDFLSESLQKQNVKYIPAGQKLGDLPGNAALYVDGNPTYETMKNNQEWLAGVDEIVEQLRAGDTVAIISFGETNRHTLTYKLLQPELNKRGYQLKYVRMISNDADFNPVGRDPREEQLKTLYEKLNEARRRKNQIYLNTIKADVGKLFPGATETEIRRLNSRVVTSEASRLAGNKSYERSPLRGLQTADYDAWVRNVQLIAAKSAEALSRGAKMPANAVETQAVLLTKMLALHGNENAGLMLNNFAQVAGVDTPGEAAKFIEKIFGSAEPFGTLVTQVSKTREFDLARKFTDSSNEEIVLALQLLASLSTDMGAYTSKAVDLMLDAGVAPFSGVARGIGVYDAPFIRTYQDAVINNPGQKVNIFGEVLDDEMVAIEIGRVIDNIANAHLAEAVRYPEIPTGASIAREQKLLRQRLPDVSANDEGVNVVNNPERMKKRKPVAAQTVVRPMDAQGKLKRGGENPIRAALLQADYAITNSVEKPVKGLKRPYRESVADEASAQLPSPPTIIEPGKKIFVTYDDTIQTQKTLLEVAESINTAYIKNQPEIIIPETQSNLALLAELNKRNIPVTIYAAPGGVTQESNKTFQRIRGGAAGRGTPEGDAKDKAMRAAANSAIVELKPGLKRPSSSQTTLKELGAPSGDLSGQTIMLARNTELSGQPLTQETKQQIGAAKAAGAKFVVGDAETDKAFHEFLKEMDAPVTVYYGGEFPRFGGSTPAFANITGGFTKETRPQIATFDTTNQADLVDIYDHVVGFAKTPLPNIQEYISALYRVAGNSAPGWEPKNKAREILRRMNAPYEAGSRGEARLLVIARAAQSPEGKRTYANYVNAFKELNRIDPFTNRPVYFDARRAGVDIFGQVWNDVGKNAKQIEAEEAAVVEIRKQLHPYTQWNTQTYIKRNADGSLEESETPMGDRINEIVSKARRRKEPALGALIEEFGAQRAHELWPYVRHNEYARELDLLNKNSADGAKADADLLESRNLADDSLHRGTYNSHLVPEELQQFGLYSSADAMTTLSRAYVASEPDTIAPYLGSTISRTQYQYTKLAKERLFKTQQIINFEKALSDDNVLVQIFDKRLGMQLDRLPTRAKDAAEPTEADFMRDPEAAKRFYRENKINQIGDEGGALIRMNLAEEINIASFAEDVAQLLRVPTSSLPEVTRAVAEALEMAVVAGGETGQAVFNANAFRRNLLGSFETLTQDAQVPLTKTEQKLYDEGKLLEKVQRSAIKTVEKELNLSTLLGDTLNRPAQRITSGPWEVYDEEYTAYLAQSIFGRTFENGQAIASFLRERNLTLPGAWNARKSAAVAERELLTDADAFNGDEILRIVQAEGTEARIAQMFSSNDAIVERNLLNIKNVSARNFVNSIGLDAFKRSAGEIAQYGQYVVRDEVYRTIFNAVQAKIKKGTRQHYNATMIAYGKWHATAIASGAIPVTKLTKVPLNSVNLGPQKDWAYISYIDVFRTLVKKDSDMEDLFRAAEVMTPKQGFPVNVVEEAAVLAMKLNRSDSSTLLYETKQMLLSEYIIQRLKTIDPEYASKVNPLRGQNFETAFVARLTGWLADSSVAGELIQKHNVYGAAAYSIADKASNKIVEPVQEAIIRVSKDIQRSSAASHEALNQSIDDLRAALKEAEYGKNSLENVLSLRKLQKFHVEHFSPIDINSARHSQRLQLARKAAESSADRRIAEDLARARGEDGLGTITLKQAQARQESEFVPRLRDTTPEGKMNAKAAREVLIERYSALRTKSRTAFLRKVRDAQNTERANLAADTLELAKEIQGEDVQAMAGAALAAGDNQLLAAAYEKTINMAENVESFADDLTSLFTHGPVYGGYHDFVTQTYMQGKKGNYAEHIVAEQTRGVPDMPPESLREAIEATPENLRQSGQSFERTGRTARFMTAMSGRAGAGAVKHIQVTMEAGMDAIRNMFERGVDNILAEGKKVFANDQEFSDFGWQVIMATFGPKNARQPLNAIAKTPEQTVLAEKIVHATATLFDTEYAHTLSLTGLDTNHINKFLGNERSILQRSEARLPENKTGFGAVESIPVMLENMHNSYLKLRDAGTPEALAQISGLNFSVMLKGYNKALRDAALAPHTAARFSAQFGHRAFGYETVKDALADGFVQPKVGVGAGTLFEWLDKTQAYPVEMLRQIRQLEKFMDYDTENVGKLLRAFDKPTTVIKSSLTLWKTGHHAVSAMGEGMMNVLAGVYNPYRYAQATRVLRAGGEFRRGSIFGENILDLEDWVGGYSENAVRNPTRKIMEQSGNKGIPVRIGNTTSVIPDAVFYREFMRRGLGISANVAEDLIVQSDQIVKSGGALKKIFNPIVKANQGLAEFSARRDNLFRLAHAIDMAQKRTFATADEMWEAMGLEITQWHPTMQSLAGFERKYMRRFVFFYTWMRNATNKIVESIVENPQAFMFGPRVNYAISGAMGGEPQSVGQPAPNDPRIPDFYARQVLGPAWYDDEGNVVGITINAPQLDIMQSLIGGIQYDTNLPLTQQLVPNAGRFLRENVIGTLNPIMKGMIEIPYDTEIRPYGPVPIEDVGEYITDLTGLGYISRGTGTAFINEQGFLQPRTDRDDTLISQLEKQNRSNINALTGLRFAEYNKYFETAQRQRQERQQQYLENFQKTFGKGG
jgi:hypothetical protein